MNNEGKVLNKEQLEAIKYGGGPLLIIAGAGTGKTTVVTERIKWLITKGLVKPEEILALTFIDKAAREMEERVDIAMPYGYTQMWIMTFHSFGEKILRSEALHIGLDPHSKLMSDTESFLFVKKNFWKFDINYFRPSGNPYKFIEGMIQHFSRLKDEDISPTEYIQWVSKQKLEATRPPASSLADEVGRGSKKLENNEETDKWLELAKAYKTYEDLKIKEGMMDFGDLITNTLKIFRTRKNVLREYQEKFKYVLVDEFQDTNISQNELIKLLAGEKKNLTVVADDDQSIYRFRGAAVSNIIQFQENFQDTKIISLTKNYRSTQEILDKAYQLIQNNNPDRLEVKAKINKKLSSMRKIKGEKINFLYTDRVENEAEEVVKEIEQLTANSLQGTAKDKSYQFKDIAILVRANNHAEVFTRALSRHNIPYQFLGPGQLFKQPEVKDLIAYLKVLNDFTDSASLYRVLTMEIWGIWPRDLVAMTAYAKRQNLSLFEVMEQVKQENKEKVNVNNRQWQLNVSKETEVKIEKIVQMIYRHFKLIPKETAGQVLFYFLEDSGLLKKLTDYQTVKEEKRANNITKFFDKLKQYEVDHEEASISPVCDFIDLSMSLGESPLATNIDWTENNAVNLLSVHSSKGLEFPIVFLVNLVAQRFPTTQRREQIPIPEVLIKEILPEGDYHLEEERRLFYVGMTRARDLLYLTLSNFYGDGKRERKISPFVIETLGEKTFTKKNKSEKNQLSLWDWGKTEENTQEEKKIEKRNHLVNYLSYSQIETFKACPRQYQYRNIFRIPSQPTSAQSFGNSLHATLRDFYRGLSSGQKLTKDDLITFLEKNWLAEGYASKKHQQLAKVKAQKFLKLYFEKYHNDNLKPIGIEEPFILRLSTGLKVGGKIDRVDKIDDRILEIIDYKTGGKVPTQKEVDNNFQLTVYTLAATDKGIFNRQPEEVKLSLYFFENNQKISTARNVDQLKKAKEEIIKIAQEISQSDFSPKVSNLCDFCDYRMLCDAWK